MTATITLFEDSDDTRGAIMKATFHALCEHGYADLTIQRIGDHFEKSKSLLYHHYDSKDELLLDFLGFMLERLEDQLPIQEDGDVESHIQTIVDLTFRETSDDRDFSRTMVELRAQAAHDERYREHFTRSDRFVRKHLAYVIRSGIDQGVFRDVDPRQTAALFQTVFTGVMTQKVTSEDTDIETIQAEFERYVRECLLAGESADDETAGDETAGDKSAGDE